MLKENLFQNTDEVNKARERYLAILVCFLIGFSPVKLGILNMLPYKMDVIILNSIYIIMWIIVIKKILSRVQIDSLFLVLFFVIAWSLALLSNTDYLNFYLDIGYRLFFISIPSYILVRCIKDYTQLKKFLIIVSVLITISMFISMFIFNVNEDVRYSQTTGYILLPAAVISANTLFKKFSLMYLANIMIALFLIIASGARGPLICFGMFIATKIVLESIIGIKRMITVLLIGTSLSIAISIYWSNIIFEINRIIIEYGFSDRIILSIIDNKIFFDPARNLLRDFSLTIILNNPFWGTGIASERLLLSRMMGESSAEAIGWYPHNFFLEILLQFGIILGIAILLFFVYLLITAFLKNKDKDMKDILIIFLAAGFYPLLLSGSYLQSPLFFAFIGFCINALTIQYTQKFDTEQ